MTLAELLSERQLTTALILDDAYDSVPKAEDLVAEDSAWSVFLDDVSSEADKITAVFAAYEEMDGEELRTSDEFVAAIWSLRDTLEPKIWKPLFESYEQGVETDRKFLDTLEAELKRLGVTPIKAGRTVPAAASKASIIFVDLFLGASQQDPDMDRSVSRVNELLAERRKAPPLVVLMSRSERLRDKKEQFRDRAFLLGAMFRVYSKKDLADGVTLPRTLERMATYYPDALRVAAFIHAWDGGLKAAHQRFLSVIRRLDLTDYAQIRQILLEFEGQPLGSYVLDVFDRVLQHEIEADEDTIAAAASLNKIDAAKYPAPYIAGSSDLQQLAFRSIWQNPQRLKVKASDSGAPVSFGDVLIAKKVLDSTAHTPADEDALVVLTASCDLVRARGAKRLLLMAGSIASLTPTAWTYKTGTLRTPIVVLPDGRRMWVKWNTKDLQALLPDQIIALLAESGTYRVTHRLREAHALELQQAMLSDVGRVGVLAQMPATFHVSVQASTISLDGTGLNALRTPVLSRDGGICYTGRDAKGNVDTHLILTEEAADELAHAIADIDPATIFPKTRSALQRLMDSSFLSELQLGIDVPTKAGWAPIKALVNDNLAEIGLIARNPEESVPNGNTLQQNGALVLLLTDDVQSASTIMPGPSTAPSPQPPPSPARV